MYNSKCFFSTRSSSIQVYFSSIAKLVLTVPFWKWESQTTALWMWARILDDVRITSGIIIIRMGLSPVALLGRCLAEDYARLLSNTMLAMIWIAVIACLEWACYWCPLRWKNNWTDRSILTFFSYNSLFECQCSSYSGSHFTPISVLLSLKLECLSLYCSLFFACLSQSA